MMKKKESGAGFWKKSYLVLMILVMYVPILLVVIYSFNESRLSSSWGGFSLRWYAELFRDRAMFEALRNSVALALSSSFIAALIGTAGAAAMARVRPAPGKASRVMEYLSILPIMIPEIIMGMILLAFFSLLGFPPGMITLVIAHACFCIPYVYLLLKARLAGLDKSYAEAARNLGAKNRQAFRDITLPLVFPAVVSGILLSFTMSFDDVIISVFVTGPQINTLPIRIYSQIKTGVTPKTNAMCAMLFAVTILLCILAHAVLTIKPHGSKSESPPRKKQKVVQKGVHNENQ